MRGGGDRHGEGEEVVKLPLTHNGVVNPIKPGLKGACERKDLWQMISRGVE